MKKLIYILFLFPIILNAQKSYSKVILLTKEDSRVVYAKKGDVNARTLMPKNTKADADYMTIDSDSYDIAVYCRQKSKIKIYRNGKLEFTTDMKYGTLSLTLRPNDKIEFNIESLNITNNGTIGVK